MPSVTPSLVTHAFARVRPVGALWRLRGYLKPYRTQMIVMFAAAFGAVTAEIAIPLLTKAVVDGAIAHHDKSLLIPLALAAVGLGASEGLLNMIRRWIQAGAVSNIEKSIRDDLYAHLQRLQASFHDDWQSGQLLSRATTDLSAIRRFAGFGLIFLVTKTTGYPVQHPAAPAYSGWSLAVLTGCAGGRHRDPGRDRAPRPGRHPAGDGSCAGRRRRRHQRGR
jgi:ABC-type multidrug transport system fused ATPase/permease subunit